MLKRLRIYYFYVGFPFFALLIGAAIYREQIGNTITSNPHPQINYAIFVIILIGGLLILRNVLHQMIEARALAKYSEAVRNNMPPDELQEMTIAMDVDIAYVLRMLAATGRSNFVSQQEQFAIENELNKAKTRLSARMALPQFMTGLLVGLGLLGTFIGLLATLSDIATLINSFAEINMATANPVDVFRTMIERMKAPMRSMGIAFSASLFGLLGSIILGFMMVGVRRLLGEIIGILGSEVAQRIEFALAQEGFAYSRGAVKQKGQISDTQIAGQLLMREAINVIEKQSKIPDEYAPKSDAAAQSQALGGGEGGATTVVLGGGGGGGGSGGGGGRGGAYASSSLPGADSRQAAETLADTAIPRELADMLPDSAEGGLQLRALLRIEERLAESARLQMRQLSSEIDDFQKQRGDMLRSLAEQTEASVNFRGELQRVGRQLGTILGIMEKGNSEVMAQVSELMVRQSDDSAESHRLLRALLETLVRVSLNSQPTTTTQPLQGPPG